MMKRDEPAREAPLLQGEIAFEGDSPSLANLSVHIYLEDTTLADASAKVVVHQVIEDMAPDTMQNERIPFTINGTLPDPEAVYTVRVLVDVNGDGKISYGDYISTTSYPVLTRGYPDRVVVNVSKVR